MLHRLVLFVKECIFTLDHTRGHTTHSKVTLGSKTVQMEIGENRTACALRADKLPST